MATLSVAFVLVAIGLSNAALSQNATCYYPNGDVADGNFPCFLGQTVSACCGGGSVCEASGLCRAGGDSNFGISNLIRGACTDEGWNAPECPRYCLSASAGGNNLISCSNVTQNSIDFCCDHTNGCCDSGIQRFQVLDNVEIVTLATTGATITTSTATATTHSTSTSTPSTSSSTSAQNQSLPPTSGSTSPTQGPTSTSPSATPTASTTPNPGLSTGAKAGIGIGSALCVLAIVGIVFWAWRRVIRKRSEHKPLDYTTESPPWMVQGEMSGESKPSELTSKSPYDTPKELPAQERIHSEPPGELPA